ncbi:MAG: type IX secretion system membrane protein PorP/SprF, partial [Flammeovirgaceae bacterium]|nr:type IX secretion system membrane protein PorP/SprF [Flammeovirgaceae bacterium]
QYMFNGLAINPAYAGMHEALSINLSSRFQNVGLEGAPNTQSFALHSPLNNERVALGLMVVHDKISVIGQTGINGMYAYRIPLPGNGTLSLGIQGGVGIYRALYSNLDSYQTDPVFQNDVNEVRPNVGAGVIFYTPKYYVGLSMPHMVNNVFDRGVNFETVYQSNPVILTGGYVFKLSRAVIFKPNALIKMSDSRAVEFDLNANFLFDDVIWAGVSYKFSNALTLLTEIKITEQFRAGYSYSFTTGPISKAELGSHELYLNYRFRFKIAGIVSPRYF